MNAHMREIGPLLTAYADGALTPEGRAWVEAQLERDPSLRAALDAITALRGPLAGLPAAPSALDPERRQQLLAVARLPQAPRKRRLARRLVVLVAAGVAACLAAGLFGPEMPLLRIRPRLIEELGRDEVLPVRMSPVAASAPSSPTLQAEDRLMTGKLEAHDGVRIASLPPLATPPPSSGGGVDASEPTAQNQLLAITDHPEKRANPIVQTDLPDAGVHPVAIGSTEEDNADMFAPAAPRRPSTAVIQDQQEAFSAIGAVSDGEQQQHLAQVTPDRERRLSTGLAPISEAQEALTSSRWQAPAPLLPQPTLPPSDGWNGKPRVFPADLVHDLREQTPPVSTTPGDILRGLVDAHLVTLDPDLPYENVGSEAPPAWTATQAPERPLGATLLLAAHALQLQVVLEDGGCRLRSTPRPLDPTALGGWEPARFEQAFGTAPMQAIRQRPQLTFAFDADTASFHQAAAVLSQGRLPDPASIAPEQFINAMTMGYPPARGPEAVSLYAEAGPSPFATGALAPRTALVALGVVTRAPQPEERRPLHLILAIDTSGSMGRPDGLPVVQTALLALVPQLQRQDTVAVVRFADQASVVLPPTPGDEAQRISDAIRGLTAHDGTDAVDGLTLAYQLAGEAARDADRQVVLATDGAALSGDRAERLLARIDQAREHHIGLLVVGCGADERQQRVLQGLADRAHGAHCFLADAAAAQGFGATLLPDHLQVLAREVKIQMTWNPERVAYARLIGFDHRRLADQDFRREDADAGSLAHDVQATALFEVVLAEDGSGPLGEARLRLFDTRVDAIREQAFPLNATLLAPTESPRLQLLACAAELAEQLEQGWWSNVHGTDWQRLLQAIAALPPSADARQLERMARAASTLLPSSQGTR